MLNDNHKLVGSVNVNDFREAIPTSEQELGSKAASLQAAVTELFLTGNSALFAA